MTDEYEEKKILKKNHILCLQAINPGKYQASVAARPKCIRLYVARTYLETKEASYSIVKSAKIKWEILTPFHDIFKSKTGWPNNFQNFNSPLVVQLTQSNHISVAKISLRINIEK